MKRIFALLMAAALCLSLAACAAKDAPDGADSPAPAPSLPTAPIEPAPISRPLPVEEPEPETVWTLPEGITLSLLQTGYPVGTEKLTLIVDNPTNLSLGYSEAFSIQKYEEGIWKDVDFREEAFIADILYTAQPHSVHTMRYSTHDLTRPLDEGLYRLTGSSLWIGDGYAESPAWHVDFRVTADARPEPDYALYISSQPIPTAEGCMVTDRLPVYFINMTGEGGCVLDIPHLERWNDAGEWEAVPWKEGIGFCGTPDPLPAEGRSWSEELSMLWGTLEDGRYRLSYEVGPSFDTEEIAYGEFTLYTPEDNHGLPLAAGSQTEE